MLDDYLEHQREEYGREFSKDDLEEIDLIREGRRNLQKSYLFGEIEPYVLGFVEKAKPNIFERKSFKD